MTSSRGGFTIVEALVAIVILSIGLLALARSNGVINRVVGGAKWATVATEVAQLRMDRLRTAAAATTPRCTHANFTDSPGVVTTQGIQETWNVTAAGSTASLRVVEVRTAYPTPGGTRRDTLRTRISCF